MTHQENYNLSTSAIEGLTRNGLEAIPELVRVILNSVMQAERSIDRQNQFMRECKYIQSLAKDTMHPGNKINHSF